MVRCGPGGGGVEWCLMVLSRGGHFSEHIDIQSSVWADIYVIFYLHTLNAKSH